MMKLVCRHKRLELALHPRSADHHFHFESPSSYEAIASMSYETIVLLLPQVRQNRTRQSHPIYSHPSMHPFRQSENDWRETTVLVTYGFAFNQQALNRTEYAPGRRLLAL